MPNSINLKKTEHEFLISFKELSSAYVKKITKEWKKISQCPHLKVLWDSELCIKAIDILITPSTQS